MSQIAVLGLGRFGAAVARKLSENGVDVLAVDRNEGRVQELRDVVHAAIVGDATDRKTLESLQLAEFNGVILCLGDRMDASILAALHLRELGVEHIWAKALDEDHATILSKLGVSNPVLPERDTALRLADEISFPNLLDFIPLYPDYSIMEVAPRAEFVGKSLRDLDLRAKHGVELVAVQELIPERMTIAPGGDYVIKESDVLVVLGRNEDIDKITKSE